MVGSSILTLPFDAVGLGLFADPNVAVVPIVVNAGAALLPAAMAVVASFVAILFKPKELIRVCTAKPWIPLLVLVVVGGIGGIIWLWPAPAAPEAAGRSRGGAAAATVSTVGSSGVQVDWTRIALARIKAGPVLPALAQPSQGGLVQAAGSQSGAAVGSEQSNQPFVFRGGIDRTGAINPSLSGSLQQAWYYYPTWIDEDGIEQEDTEAMILSSPAYHSGRVFGASCMLDPPYSYGSIFCLDAQTGEQIWTVGKIDGEDMIGFFSSPAVTADGRYLLIGQGLHPDANCNLICIDTETGEVHWTIQVELHIESSPVIDGDMVYVGCGAIEDPTTKKPISHTGFVLAARISDGQEQWRFDVVDPESSPIVQDDVLYIGSGFNGQAVVAIDTKEGVTDRLLWNTPTPYPITGATTLMGDTVIVGGGNGDFVFRDPNPAGVVMALDKKTGEIRWTTDLPDAVLGAVAAGDSLICPVASGEVVALNPADGQKQWATKVSGHMPVLAACAVTGQSIFAISQDGYLGQLDLATGDLVEKHYVNSVDRPGAQGLSISSPLVVGNQLFVGSETGGLRCYQGTPAP